MILIFSCLLDHFFVIFPVNTGFLILFFCFTEHLREMRYEGNSLYYINKGNIFGNENRGLVM